METIPRCVYVVRRAPPIPACKKSDDGGLTIRAHYSRQKLAHEIHEKHEKWSKIHYLFRVFSCISWWLKNYDSSRTKIFIEKVLSKSTRNFSFPRLRTYYQEPLALVKRRGASMCGMIRGDKYLDCFGGGAYRQRRPMPTRGSTLRGRSR